MNPLTGLTPKQLRRAADLKERIDSLQKELDQLLGTTAETVTTEAPNKRKVSAKGRANIRAAAKRRGAQNKEAEVAAEPAEKPKREVSPASRRKMKLAQKARREREAQAKAAA